MSDIESQRVLGAGIPRTGRLVDVAFPHISMDKSIVWITLVQLAVYVLSCAMSSAFEPTERVLYQLGATYGPAVRHFEAWRLVMPVFLHVGVVHLLFNVIFILHMGLDKEIKYGRTNFLILYFSSGMTATMLQHTTPPANNRPAALMGNMLTVFMRPCSLAVGASTAGFVRVTGLVGSILAEILIVWHKLDERTRNMYTLDITVFGALMILLSYGQTVDIWGHLGGFICGVAVTCEFNKNIRDLPSWFGMAMNGTRTACIGIVILTLSRVFLGLPVPMGCA